jgi:hypothetical protein
LASARGEVAVAQGLASGAVGVREGHGGLLHGETPGVGGPQRRSRRLGAGLPIPADVRGQKL